MKQIHRIQFPPAGGHDLGQDEAYFFVTEEGKRTRLRFHDYCEIYNRPGLYEQIFYDRLKCSSPRKVTQILKSALDAEGENISELRVLDLGAGNGVMGEELKVHAVARMVGADIIPEAKMAADRDRPGLYDEYYVSDFSNLPQADGEALDNWSFNCLTSVAALGFGDIPPQAFLPAMRMIADGGWLAFNIKDSFLDRTDDSGFSRFIRELIFSKYIDIHHLERYRHRLSMEGLPLHYFALVARKAAQIPVDFLEQCGIGEGD